MRYVSVPGPTGPVKPFHPRVIWGDCVRSKGPGRALPNNFGLRTPLSRFGSRMVHCWTSVIFTPFLLEN